MTQLQLEVVLNDGTLAEVGTCVMIQCVGSRNDQRQYCSRVCCLTALKNAMAMKKKWPKAEIVIMFRDMMSYGFSEKYYKTARRMGIRFIRFSQNNGPAVEKKNDGLYVRCFDTALGETTGVLADRLVLSSAMIPNTTADIAGIFKLPRTRDGFFHEAHMKLKPIDFAADGFYMAGTCHAPKNISETITQALGAAGRALTTLAKDAITVDAMVARVNSDACAACLTCVRTCPFGVPMIDEDGSAVIDASKCKGCGTCAAECPAKAIDLMHSRDVQIIAKVRAAMSRKA